MIRIFQLALDVFQPMSELYHVFFSVLLKHLQLNVKGLVPDDCQLLQMDEMIDDLKKIKN